MEYSKVSKGVYIVYDMEEVLRERKTDRQGIRFRPSVIRMLKELSTFRKLSMADYLERLVIEDYKKQKGQGDKNDY